MQSIFCWCWSTLSFILLADSDAKLASGKKGDTTQIQQCTYNQPIIALGTTQAKVTHPK